MKQFLNHPKVKTHMKQGMKFIMSGLIGASIEFSILAYLVEIVHMAPQYAYIFSTAAAVIFVFFFNKYVTFKNKERGLGKQTMKFIIVYAFAIGLNYLVTLLLYLSGVHYMLSKAIAIGAIAFMNYFLSAGFIFKRNRMEGLEEVPVL